MTCRPTRRSRVLSLIATVAAIVGLAVPLAVSGPTAPAAAITGADFDPGRIIDDALFYDGGAMTANEIQSFLDTRIGACANGSCLNVYVAEYGGRLRDVAANGNVICEAIPAGSYSIAQLIFTAQQACGISAKVVLVTMQKEQSLVTAKSPSISQLSKAMGYNCPDTAPCNPNSLGVATQIVLGTRQLKAYGHSQGSSVGTLFGKPVGPQFIGWHPNSACGGSTVNVQNKATAALYTYTPYQPNAAALNNLHGVGNSCSSYGNRNFWVYYTNWFGSPTNPAPEKIATAYATAGGATGWLGAPVGGYQCGLVNGGCLHEYANGAIYASYRTAGFPISGAHRTAWNGLGGPQSAIGYPTSAEIGGLVADGRYQTFQSGTMYTSAGGTFAVMGAVKNLFQSMNSEWGTAGYPLSHEIRFSGGSYQEFQNGRIYWTASTGAIWVPATSVKVLASYGFLGRPTAAQLCGLADDSCAQTFTSGVIYTSPAGTFPVFGGVRDEFTRAGGHAVVGYPTTAETKMSGGVYQDFSKGRIYWTAATGARYMPTSSVEAVVRYGWMGLPTSNYLCGLVRGGCYQVFPGGVMYTSDAGVFPVRGGVKDAWNKIGSEWGKAGYPISAELGMPGGVYQEFERGRVYWSASTGARFVPTSSVAALGTYSWLGFPTSDHLCGLPQGGCYQVFQNGVLYTSPQGVFPVRGGVKTLWNSMGSEWGRAGYPISAELAGEGGVYQLFEKGRIVWTARNGASFIAQ